MIFFDTETLGLHGFPVLIQWAEDDGVIHLHNIWNTPVDDTLELCKRMTETEVCGFNLAFDWFHICKVYTTWRLIDPDVLPLHQVDAIIEAEEKARSGPCLKPKGAVDLMLIARKGPYQSTMDRNDITIRRVPSLLAHKLAEHLSKAIPLKDIYFARKSNPKQRWQLQDVVDDLGDFDTNFKNVVLRFAPSSALKALAHDALDIEEDKIIKFYELDPPSYKKVDELGYAPFAKAMGPRDKTWAFWVYKDVAFWDTNKKARQYASDDVKYTRLLYYKFDQPSSDDVDSNLACMVSAVRWRGYSIDIERIQGLKKDAEEMLASLPFNVNSPEVCKKYLKQVMSDLEFGVMSVNGKASTKKVILEEIAKWNNCDICPGCEGMGCAKCGEDGTIETGEPHPAAVRAQLILDARSAAKELEIYNKLIRAGRFHASFKVIGALSSRMSGADGLNAQGIKRAEYVRDCFTLADGGLVLCGGDFESFEMNIMDAVYHDPKMHAELTGESKIHALWGQRYFFPRMSYDEIIASKKSHRSPWEDFYTRSKNGVFAICYFGEAHTLITRVGIPEETAQAAYQKILEDYPVFAAKRQDVTDMFCSMKQPGGIGTKVSWSEPADYIESVTGFRRYFTLENRICESLYKLSCDPPKDWNVKANVMRRDRQQTACGAMRSALLGAAFGLQASNMRAAGNHRIQSTGATLTKELQYRIWGHQPAGIHSWKVQPMNVHDEIMCPTTPELVEDVAKTVDEYIEDMKSVVPLIGIEWFNDISSWASKGGEGDTTTDLESIDGSM